MIFTIQTDDEVAGFDITNALSSAGIKHAILSKQNDNAVQQRVQADGLTPCPICGVPMKNSECKEHYPL